MQNIVQQHPSSLRRTWRRQLKKDFKDDLVISNNGYHINQHDPKERISSFPNCSWATTSQIKKNWPTTKRWCDFSARKEQAFRQEVMLWVRRLLDLTFLPVKVTETMQSKSNTSIVHSSWDVQGSTVRLTLPWPMLCWAPCAWGEKPTDSAAACWSLRSRSCATSPSCDKN